MTGKEIGRNTNVNDGTDGNRPVTIVSVALNSDTAVKILDANDSRISVNFGNDTSKTVKIKYQPASVDNLKVGINLWGRSDREMTPDNLYTGEISAIAISGTPTIDITEY